MGETIGETLAGSGNNEELNHGDELSHRQINQVMVNPCLGGIAGGLTKQSLAN